jgi:hypothetical protein
MYDGLLGWPAGRGPSAQGDGEEEARLDEERGSGEGAALAPELRQELAQRPSAGGRGWGPFAAAAAAAAAVAGEGSGGEAGTSSSFEGKF